MLKQAKKRKQRFKNLFNSPVGKEVLTDLFKLCRVNRTDVTDNARKDAYNQGRRSVYVSIINILGQDLEKIIVESANEEIL